MIVGGHSGAVGSVERMLTEQRRHHPDDRFTDRVGQLLPGRPRRARVIIGVDPHKRSATIEIINEREQAVGQGQFGTDRAGCQAMLAAGREYRDRVWAVEGCSRIGRHVA